MAARVLRPRGKKRVGLPLQAQAAGQLQRKKRNTNANLVSQQAIDAIDFSRVYEVVYSPESWACRVTGTTDDVLILLSSGKVLCRDSALDATRNISCPLALEINGEHCIFSNIAGEFVNVTDSALHACAPLRAAVKGLRAMQPHNRVPPTSAAARWARLRALVRFMTLPCFSLAARRQRQAEALHATAVHRMRNFSMHKAFAGWKAHQTSRLAASGKSRNLKDKQVTLSNRLCGLRNLGNTCYMNAVLQCLLHCTELRGILAASAAPASTSVARRRKLFGTPPCNAPVAPSPSLVQQELGSLVRAWGSSPAPSLLVPQGMLDAVWRAHPQFVGFCQQDAQELLSALLEDMGGSNEAEGGAAAAATSDSPAALFRHCVQQRIVCAACKHSSAQQTSCCAPITVTIPPVHQTFKAPGRRGASLGRAGDAAVQVQALLHDELYACDALDGVLCDGCGQRGPSMRHTALLTPPHLLAVHVNRTSWAHGGRKVQTHVHMPVTLSLKHGCQGEHMCQFRLRALVVHEGRSLSSGHYTARAWQHQGEQRMWLELNDDRVSRTDEETALGTQAYLSFYERI